MLRILNENYEEGKKDLEKGAGLGNSLAKQELIKLNPYSRLCNEMLIQMFKKELQFS